MNEGLPVISEKEATTILRLALAEVERLGVRLDDAQRAKDFYLRRHEELSQELRLVTNSCDTASAMAAHASEFKAQLEAIAEEVGADGVGDILARLEELRWKREKLEQENATLQQRAEQAQSVNAHYHARWSDVARVADAWRSYRAQVDTHAIPYFEELAQALDLLIANAGGQG